MVRHHGLLLLGHIPQTQSSRIKASKYPLDEEGDNLNSYGSKNKKNKKEEEENLHGAPQDLLGCNKISQRSWNKVGDASERNKTGGI